LTTAVLSSETASTSRGDLGLASTLPGRRRRPFFARVADRNRSVVSPFDNTADTNSTSEDSTSSSDDENDVERSSLHRHTGILILFNVFKSYKSIY
jgi:hypothetical protein